MKKVLLVSNAHAGSVSARAKEVISKALSADFKLEVTDTARRSHASELARDAVDRDFDAVVAFGGDGTINEVAQGLVGTDVALGILPGGSTNVMARSLGVPSHPIDATAFVAAHLRADHETSRSRRSGGRSLLRVLDGDGARRRGRASGRGGIPKASGASDSGCGSRTPSRPD